MNKSRVFPKTPAQFLIAHACHLREMSTVAVFRKGPAVFGKRAVADVGIQRRLISEKMLALKS